MYQKLIMQMRTYLRMHTRHKVVLLAVEITYVRA